MDVLTYPMWNRRIRYSQNTFFKEPSDISSDKFQFFVNNLAGLLLVLSNVGFIGFTFSTQKYVDISDFIWFEITQMKILLFLLFYCVMIIDCCNILINIICVFILVYCCTDSCYILFNKYILNTDCSSFDFFTESLSTLFPLLFHFTINCELCLSQINGFAASIYWRHAAWLNIISQFPSGRKRAYLSERSDHTKKRSW